MAPDGRPQDHLLDLYRTLGERSLDIMLFFRAGSGAIIGANRAALEAYGYTSDEILTKSFYDIRVEHTWSEIPAQMERARNGSFRFETVHRRKDGVEFPVEATWSFAQSNNDDVILSVIRDISDRKQIEKALLESERDLFDFFENSAVGLHWVGPDGMIMRVNQAELEMLGYGHDEYIGRHIADFHDDRKVIDDILARLTGGEMIRDYPARLKHKDGSLRDVLITSSVLFQDGEFIHTRCFTSDVTASRRAEEQRAEILQREAEARHEAETLNKLAATLAAELELETLVQHVTDAATALTGAEFGAFFYNVLNDDGESYQLYTLSGAPRSAFEKFGMPRNTPIFDPTFRGSGIVRIDDVTEDPRYGTMEPHHGMPKGHLPVRSYLAAPVISRSGEVLGGLFFGHSETCVFTDSHERMIGGLAAHAAVAMDNARLYRAAQLEINQRKSAEEELRLAHKTLGESEERFRLLVQHSALIIWRTGPDGRYTSPQESFERFTGLTFDEYGSDGGLKAVHPDDVAGVGQAWAAAVADPRPFEWEYRLRNREGEYRHMLARGIPLFAGDGSVREWMGYVEDITGRKAAEEQLRLAHQVLEQKVAERTLELQHLAKDLSYEVEVRTSAEQRIRQIMTRLVNIQEEERRRIGRNIHDHLGQQLTGLRVNLASLEGQVRDDAVLAPLAQTVQSIAEELDASIDFVTWELLPGELAEVGIAEALHRMVKTWSRRFEIPAEFISRGADDLVLAEETKANLYRITQEALHNIVKHAQATHAEVLFERSGPMITLIVEDDGRGFAAGLDPVGTHSLGLTSMRERALLMEGTFEIESRPGNGTTVFVRVPC